MLCKVLTYKTKSSVGVYPEHRQTWAKLKALPPSSIEWSILCPGIMRPLSKTTYPLAHQASAKNISLLLMSPLSGRVSSCGHH